jgi:Spy/CpxP family protein refolding chaperone
MINNQRLLELALQGLEAERQRIENEIASLRQQLANRSSARSAAEAGRAKTRRRGVLTPEGRKKLSDSMKARWAAKRVGLAKRAKR